MLQVVAVCACNKSICSHPEDISSSNDSFCLQVKIKCTQSDCKKIPTQSHFITNLAYRLKPHHTRNQYLRARLDTCMDVNTMPASVYKLVFTDPELNELAPSTLEIGIYTTDTVKIVGSCVFYLVHPDTKNLHKVTFFVATNDGSVLLSYTTALALGSIQPRTRLDYLPPRASLITSTVDCPMKTKSRVSVHSSRKEVFAQSSKQESTVSNWQQSVPKLLTSKEQILQNYPEVFDGIGCFPGPPYPIQLDPDITLKQTSCQPIPVYMRKPLKQEIDKMLKVGVLKSVHEATPWMNSFVLVEGKDKLGSLESSWILQISTK